MTVGLTDDGLAATADRVRALGSIAQAPAALRIVGDPPFVLWVIGPGGAGKSTVARALVALRPGVEILRAGVALKAMLRSFYAAAGFG